MKNSKQKPQINFWKKDNKLTWYTAQSNIAITIIVHKSVTKQMLLSQYLKYYKQLKGTSKCAPSDLLSTLKPLTAIFNILQLEMHAPLKSWGLSMCWNLTSASIVSLSWTFSNRPQNRIQHLTFPSKGGNTCFGKCLWLLSLPSTNSPLTEHSFFKTNCQNTLTIYLSGV